MKNLLYLLLIPVLLTACKAKQPPVVEETVAVIETVAAPEVEATPEAQTQDNKYRYIVSFYSIGTGVNGKAVQQLEAFIKQFETKNKVSVPYVPVRWGREGEVDYCFKLNGMTAVQQVSFIKESQELLKGAEHINYKENETR